MYSDGWRVKFRVSASTSGSGYVAVENSKWYGLMPESATPTTVIATVDLARRSASPTRTEVVWRRSKPFESVALKVTCVRPSGSLIVVEAVLLSSTPSPSVSQPTVTGAVPPLTLPLRVCVAPVRNLYGPVVETVGRGSDAAGVVTLTVTVSGTVVNFSRTAFQVPAFGLPTPMVSGAPADRPGPSMPTPVGSTRRMS